MHDTIMQGTVWGSLLCTSTIDCLSKGLGIVSEIQSILDEIPFCKHTVTKGLKLREVMLLNIMLFNSEAWHGVTKSMLSH